MRKLLLIANLSLLAACSGEGSDPASTEPDAAVQVPILPYREYVIDKITVPTSTSEARTAGMDLNNDGVVDNKLGDVIGVLSSLGIDAQATVTSSIDRGETILLARIGTTSFTNAPVATLQTFSGSDPSIPACSSETDTTCRHHLQGNASFVASADPAGQPLIGSIDSSMLTASGGQLVVRIALLGSQPIDLVLGSSRAQLTMTTEATIGSAKLAGVVSVDDINDKVIPAVHDNMMTAVTRDCTALTAPPACGCADNSDGKQAIMMFDQDTPDCDISIQDIADNTLVKAMLKPDIEINGKMGLSLGVTATAVSAAFPMP